MAETDHTPKMFPKFIQLVALGDVLWALDENGDVFLRDTSGHTVHPVWRKSKTVRENP